MDDVITISTQRINEDCSIITLAGRFDAGTTNILKEVFSDVIGGSTRYVVIDMEQVSFIDSASLSALVSAQKQVQRVGGSLLLAGLQNQPRTLFSLTMLDQLISIYPDRQAALDSLK